MPACPELIATPVREVFCPELVIFPKTGVQIGNTGGFLLPSTSGRGGHKKRWPVPEPLQLFRESLPLPCFPCASFLFKSDLYSPSIAGSASKAAPCLPSRWPFRHAPRCGVERSEYSERESLSWGAGKGRGSLFILTGISLIPSFIEYRVTVLSGAFPSLLGIVWRVSAAFLGDAVLKWHGTLCYGVLAPLQRVKTIPSSPIVSRRAPPPAYRESCGRLQDGVPPYPRIPLGGPLLSAGKSHLPRTGEVMRPQTG